MLKFVIPSVGIWVANPLLSLVDTMVVGATSTVQLAALGPGTVLCDYLGFIFTGLAVATTGMVRSSSVSILLMIEEHCMHCEEALFIRWRSCCSV